MHLTHCQPIGFVVGYYQMNTRPKKPVLKWFIEPLSQTTNRSLCDLLGESAIQESLECDDGVRRDLYRARSFDDIRRYSNSKQLFCNFFKQGDRGGLPQRWYPPKKKEEKKEEQPAAAAT